MQKFYHGTQKMFDKFDLSHAKEGTGLKFGFGVYVTEKYESAAHYCLVRGETVDNDRPYYVYTLEVPDQTTFSKKTADTYGAKLSSDGTIYEGPNLMGRLLMELRDNGKLEYDLPGDILCFNDLV